PVSPGSPGPCRAPKPGLPLQKRASGRLLTAFPEPRFRPRHDCSRHGVGYLKAPTILDHAATRLVPAPAAPLAGAPDFYRRMIEGMRCGILIVDRAGGIVMVNDHARSI